MKLHTHRYGKAKVRVFKKLQQDGIHTPKELEVKTLLEGDFGASYTKDDNRLVVATDTIKNKLTSLLISNWAMRPNRSRSRLPSIF